MRKKILALALCALMPAVYIAVANAEDDVEVEEVEEVSAENRNVGKRMNCDDIKKEIDRLNALDELSEEDSDSLAKLKNDQRLKCSKGAGGRMKRTKAAISEAKKSEASAKAAHKDSCDNPDKNGCCPGEKYTDLGGDQGFACCTPDGEHCYPPMGEPVEVVGCEDGGKPDENGCCAGEKYTDLGDQGFNCCKADGVTCYPPIAK